MYLADKDLVAILPQMGIETHHSDHPFDAEQQIQPCSIDLRLDNVFWRQTQTTTLDLRQAQLLELSPRRHWKRQELQPHETVLLKPGTMLLGRSYEKFSIPPSCAGKLEGRSSFARLGLAVHCSGDFINPGWRGRMPLQLINHGANTIRLVPYLPICQLTLVKLSSQPDRLYGDRTLSSKYVDDDGGPSYWWRDKLIRRLQTALGNQDVTSNVQDELITYLGSSDFAIVDRFEGCIRRLPHSALTSADDLLRNFAQAEDRQASRTKLIRAVGVGAGPALLTVSLGSLFSQPFGNKTYGGLHFTLWGVTLVFLLVSLWSYRHEVGEYLTTKRLEELRRQKINPPATNE